MRGAPWNLHSNPSNYFREQFVRSYADDWRECLLILFALNLIDDSL